MHIPLILRQLGFSEKEIRVYLTLLTGGPSSVRKLAKDTDLNRGSVYDILKSLQKRGLAGVYQKHKKQFFLAEDPERLIDLINSKEREVASIKRYAAQILPELRSLYVSSGAKPVVKYYEGTKGVAIILKDILTVMNDQSEKLYRVFSARLLRDYLYRDFPNFTKERVERHIRVRAIAVGQGGESQSLSERRWLKGDRKMPAYSIIYGPKVAFFSLGKGDVPLGVLIEDERIADMERMVFDHTWECLGGTASPSRAKTRKMTRSA